MRQTWLANIEPVIGNLKAKDVSPKDVARVLHPIIKRGAKTMANRTRSYLLSAFKYGIEWDLDPANMGAELIFEISANPVRDVPKAIKQEPVGERYLTAGEIMNYWPMWDDVSLVSRPVGLALRLMLATGGQRVEEVLRATWGEFDETSGRWEIHGSRTKSGRSHVVPLTPLAIEILTDLKALSGNTKYLFPMRGDPERPMQTNSLGNAVRRFCKRAAVAAFTARDLRRTVKTIMGEMGISKEIRDRLQNHAMTDVSSKHYDRYSYFQEKQRVMESWDRHLQSIIAGENAGSTVIKMEKQNAK